MGYLGGDDPEARVRAIPGVGTRVPVWILGSSLFGAQLAAWLGLFEGEDVCAGPVATLAEATPAFGEPAPTAPAPRLGEHTERWRAELGL